MTLPVPVFPSTTLLNTRRTHGGVLRLCPNPVVNRIIEFALGYTAEKHSIVLHAHVSLSNHHHTVFFDRFGTHPEFRRDFQLKLVEGNVRFDREGRRVNVVPIAN